MANLSNINNKFLVTTGGNVLIGQTAAVGSSILQVTGNSTFAGNVSLPDNAKAIFGTGNDLEVYHDAGNSWIKDTGSGQLRIASSTLRLYDADLSHLQAQFIDGGAVELYYSGNKKLETTNTGISVSDTVIGTTARFDTLNNNANSKNIIYRNSSSTNTVVGGGSSPDKIYIQDNGNVGIGTSSINRSGLGIDHTVVTIGTNAGMGMLELQGTRTSDADLGRIAWLNAGTRLSEIVASRIDNNTSTKMSFRTSDTGSLSTKMTILPSGDVGIGTTNPQAKLQVGSRGTAGPLTLPLTDGILFDFYNNSSPYKRHGVIISQAADASESVLDFNTKAASGTNSTKMTILGNGNVGIGTDSPTAKLHVYESDTIDVEQKLDRRGAFSSWKQTSNGGVLELKNSVNSSKALIQASGDSYFNGGNVGIGTVSPDSKLHVESTSATGANFILETTHPGGIPLLDLKGAASAQLRYKDELNVIQGRIDFGDSGTFNFIDVPNNNSTLYLKTGGNVGIGTTSPGQKLEVAGRIRVTTDPTIEFYESSVKRGGIQWSLANDNTNIFAVGGNITFDIGGEKMRIKANGQIDFASPGTPNQSGISMFGGSSGGIMYMYRPVGQNGDIIRFQTAISSTSSTRVGYINTTGSATTYNSASDYRLKENVVKITGALDRVSKLKPSRFNFIIEPENTVDGFIAHEVQEVVPEAVTGYKDEVDENGENHYQGMDNSRLVPLLAAAIQELKAEIEILKSK